MEYSLDLTILLFAPIIGSLLLIFISRDSDKLIRYTGMIFSIIAFLVSLLVYLNFDPTDPEFQFTYRLVWIESLNISYFIGIDGISLILISDN